MSAAATLATSQYRTTSNVAIMSPPHSRDEKRSVLLAAYMVRLQKPTGKSGRLLAGGKSTGKKGLPVIHNGGTEGA
jgi:hypothetical protein